jgi:tetratricopeptide (TPR) repeat protein
VRTPPTEQDLQPSPQQGSKKEVLTVENGTEVELESGEGDNDNPIVAESDSTGDADEFETPPAEENEGWGIPDWYDASDQALEDLEIRVMLEHSKRRLVIDPNDHDALAILSYYQYLAMDYGAAEGTYDRQIHLQPDDSSAYNNKALIYKRRGQYKVEEALYRQALALAPNDPTALNNLAVCLSHQGRHEEAMEVMRQLEALDPNDAYADLHRSKIYAEMGEQDQALEYLDRALKGMKELDTLHHIEFRQDIRVDPSFGRLRENYRFKAILVRYYDKDSPLMEEG